MRGSDSRVRQGKIGVRVDYDQSRALRLGSVSVWDSVKFSQLHWVIVVA